MKKTILSSSVETALNKTSAWYVAGEELVKELDVFIENVESIELQEVGFLEALLGKLEDVSVSFLSLITGGTIWGAVSAVVSTLTGLSGAALITKTLALLGCGFGMVAGLAVLVGLASFTASKLKEWAKGWTKAEKAKFVGKLSLVRFSVWKEIQSVKELELATAKSEPALFLAGLRCSLNGFRKDVAELLKHIKCETAVKADTLAVEIVHLVDTNLMPADIEAATPNKDIKLRLIRLYQNDMFTVDFARHANAEAIDSGYRQVVAKLIAA